ncbi:hypothetical protein FA15DRAFT_592402 [Coprinopsis marcescibilis]|uniref:Mitochondrial import inner membrane translocase subunit TIM50 n=1 Tax=Coprinopsis marcescibilis TaxID=230819 RepID=A0A5C3KV79_COPMA|nr:hypothetical protein FA15DRAFT_592402 [Coprinopsis marcescibilis]
MAEARSDPNPPPPISEEYLAISSQPSTRQEDPESQRKLLILDLNGTLVYRTPHQRKTAYQVPGARALRTVHPRPYLPSFKEYIAHPQVSRWLDTMVWSSAQPHSVQDMVQKTFGSGKVLRAVWARDTLGLTQEEYNRKTQTTKNLEKPWAELGHSPKTTFLLDDSPLKAHLQPWNHLCIQEYVAEIRRDDVKVRDAEVLRERREEQLGSPQKEQQKESPTPHEELEDEDESKKRKRERGKAKKERKKAEKLAAATPSELEPVDANRRPLQYDQTLLAVIGVLDTVKNESNVAGWMRSGGLLNVSTTGEDLKSRSVTPGPLIKKPRLSDTSTTSSGLEHPPRSPSPPSSPAAVGEEEVSVPAEAAINLWFEHQDAFAAWAKRGRVALEDLGIDVTHGVTGSPN